MYDDNKKKWIQENKLNIRTVLENWVLIVTEEKIQLNKIVTEWIRIKEQISKIVT